VRAACTPSRIAPVCYTVHASVKTVDVPRALHAPPLLPRSPGCQRYFALRVEGRVLHVTSKEQEEFGPHRGGTVHGASALQLLLYRVHHLLTNVLHVGASTATEPQAIVWLQDTVDSLESISAWVVW